MPNIHPSAKPRRTLNAIPDGSTTHNATLHATGSTEGAVAQITYRCIMEEGELVILNDPHVTYAIKHKCGSGRWSVQTGGKEVMRAWKEHWYYNKVQIDVGEETYEVTRPTVWRRDYVVCRLGEVEKGVSNKNHVERGERVGEVTAHSRWRRGYAVDMDEDVDVVVQVFCYWLVSLMSRRVNRSSGGSSGGYYGG